MPGRRGLCAQAPSLIVTKAGDDKQKIIAAHSESKSCRPSAHVRNANKSESKIVFTEDEVWGLDHPRDISVSGVGWHVGVTILLLLIEAKPQCFFTEAETEYLTKRIQDGRPDVVK
ncbi:hypothetical protein Tco_1435176, partial [Tanacetum coccineum]